MGAFIFWMRTFLCLSQRSGVDAPAEMSVQFLQSQYLMQQRSATMFLLLKQLL